MRYVIALSILTLLPAVAAAQDAPATNSDVIWIGLAHDSEREALMAEELRSLMRRHDIRPWVLTRKILIDQDKIPHSHPVLTLHTRHIGEERWLLATLIHEQLHWLEAEPWLEGFLAAMADFEALYPVVPSSENGGARDRQSTYRHLLVCDMELQALTTLVGEAVARETLANITHYEWVYDKVLTDPRVREIALSHGFNVSRGTPVR